MNLNRDEERLLLLSVVPPFLRPDLLDDEDFCNRLGITPARTITIGTGDAQFDQHVLFEAIRESYRKSKSSISVKDENGLEWSLAHGDDPSPAITLSSAKQNLVIQPFSWLDGRRATRMERFDRALTHAGLPQSALPEWRQLLESRSLGDREVEKLDDALKLTPRAQQRILISELESAEGSADTLVPSTFAYYEHLCGAGQAETLEELASEIAPLAIANYLAWDRREGARMALVLGSHPTITSSGGFDALESDEVRALAEWTAEQGDLLSKVSAIELCLARLREAPELAEPATLLTEQIRDLDPEDPNGRLRLLTGTFVYVLGELSRTKVLSAWRPFRRRQAALAQASLFERVAFGRIQVDSFAGNAIRARGNQYYLQCLVDLREEPRWLPDFASPEQLKHEMVGRISNAAALYAENIPKGPLRSLLTGKGKAGLRKVLHFPGSFLPGPLEGAARSVSNPIPPEFEALLDESLTGERLGPKSVIALINLHGLFSIGGEKIEQVIGLIRDANHRFSADLETSQRNLLIAGLANVACSTRNVTLSNELRMMIRKNRVDRLDPPGAKEELLTALLAGAAHEDLEAWVDFVGDWSFELALTVQDKDDAIALMDELELLCIIEPILRRTVGKSIAAVQAHLGI